MAKEFKELGCTLQELADIVWELEDEKFHDFCIYLADNMNGDRNLERFISELKDMLEEIEKDNSYIEEHFLISCPICRKPINLNNWAHHVKKDHEKIYNMIKEM